MLPMIAKFLRDEFAQLEHKQLTPWAFFNTGPPMEVRDFRGRQISYQGIRFEGSPELVFWRGYIEPFLEDIAFRAVDYALKLCADRQVHAKQSLLETERLLDFYIPRVYARMADIDRRLRGRGFPNKVPLRDTAPQQRGMQELVKARVQGELRVLRPESSRWRRANQWIKDHPIVTTAIGTAVALAGIALRAFG